MVSQSWIFLGFVLTTVAVQSSFALVCPPAALVYPCICNTDGSIVCEGFGFSHDHLLHVFEMLRTVNLVEQFYYLDIYSFTITNTEIEILDVRFLANHTRFENLVFTGNHRMNQVILPSGPWPWRAQAENVVLSNNAFLKDSMNAFLVLLGDSIKTLDLSQNNIQGFSGREIVDGLPALGNLEVLNLGNNFLTTIGSSPFYHNSRLITLDLSYNRISNLGRNTFEFGDSYVELLDVPLNIFLNGNGLNDGAISPESRLDNIGRPLRVHFENNNFVFLSAANFETALYVNFDNVLYFSSNSFICDQRMAWLKDARMLLEERVQDVYCLNDPGYTIFNTERV